MEHTPPGGPSVVDWLLEGDVAVAFGTRRDLLHEDAHALRERIAEEGYGAALLAARRPDGQWGRGFYQPKWTSTHYTLLELRNLDLPPHNKEAGETVEMLLRSEKGGDGGLNPSGTISQSDGCINGMALNYAAYFGADQEGLVSVVDFLLGQRLADGGFNCRLNRSGARHSSMHTTICVVEGFTEYLRSGYAHRNEEVAEARSTAIEFLLRHRLYRSERTGEPIDDEFTRLHHPTRWHYDILRGLGALADAGTAYDDRLDDALDVLEHRRRPDGRWAANRTYPGATHVPPPRAGAPNRWVTLAALRVLAAYRP